jgi:hypothetical protein
MREYRRRLPHFHRDDVPLFLTWRLWGGANWPAVLAGQALPPLVRSDKEFGRIVWYIEENPVLAGLVDWPSPKPGTSGVWQAKPPAPPSLDPPSARQEM